MSCSVLIPAYNASHTIEETIRSVLDQTIDAPIEVIVCDDRSSDDTVAKVQAMAAVDKRIVLLCNTENMGVSRTRNRMLDHVQSQWIAFLDADDIFLPEKLERCVAELQKTQSQLLFHNLGYLLHSGEVKGKVEGIGFPPAAIFSKEAIGDMRFNTSLLVGEDTDFFRRVKLSAKWVHFPQVLTGMRIQPGSLTDRNWLLKRVVEHWHSEHDGDGKTHAPTSAVEYMGYFRSMSPLRRFGLYRQWLGQKFGRLGAGHLFAGKKIHAVRYLIMAGLLNPGYLMDRLMTKR